MRILEVDTSYGQFQFDGFDFTMMRLRELDAIAADTPAGLIAKDYHSLWLNSAALALANAAPFSPLAMAIPFSVGQFLMAFVLYRATGDHDGQD